jgi:hypothetical protein
MTRDIRCKLSHFQKPGIPVSAIGFLDLHNASNDRPG